MFCASKFAPYTGEKLIVARLFEDEFRQKAAKTIVVEAITTNTPEEAKIVQNGPTTPFSISDFTFTGTGEPRLCRDFEKSYIDGLFEPMPDTIPTPLETPTNHSQLAELAEWLAADDWRNHSTTMPEW